MDLSMMRKTIHTMSMSTAWTSIGLCEADCMLGDP
jgi:hypothetical protein